MGLKKIKAFNHTLENSYEWVKDIMVELKTEDDNLALKVLRATLKTLRDRLTVEEAAQLGAQLPALIRGFYYEGWSPAGRPLKLRSKEKFLSMVREHLNGFDYLDIDMAVQGVFRVICKRISAGEVTEIKQEFPKPLRKLWPDLNLRESSPQ